jgi:hypothetical protein
MDNPVAGLADYELRHLAEHLAEAGRAADLHRLLALETAAQHNAWYEVKEARENIADYAADVQRAWNHAENDYRPADNISAGENISLQCRYALIASSLNSLAENVPPRLLHFLVKEGVWSLQRGIFYARQIPNGWQRAEAMIAILPLLEEETERMKWWRETLANIQAVKYWGGRDIINFLENLVLSYPDPKPEEVVRTVLALIPEKRKTAFFMMFEPFLPEGLLVEGLEWVRLNGGKATEFATLAHRLPTRERAMVFEEIVEEARSMENVSELDDAFLALEQYEPLLAKILLSKIHPYVTRVDFSETDVLDNSSRLHLFIEVLPYLEEDEQERLLQRVLDLLTEMDHAFIASITEVFLSLASHAPSPSREKVLAQSINVLRRHIYSMAEMVPYFEGEQQEQVLKEILREIHEDAMYLDTREIRGLFRYLSSASLQDVLAFTKQNLSGISRVRTLASLAELLTGPEREGVLHEALEETQTIILSHEHNEALSLLAPLLPTPLLKEALKIAKVVSEGTSLLHGFSYWLASIPDAAREQVGRFSIKLLPSLPLEEEWAQVPWIDELAHYWPEALVADALALVRAYQEPTNKAKALAILARSMMAQELEREKVLLEALAEVDNIKNIRRRAETLAKLAAVPCPSQNDAVVQRALEVLAELDDKEMQAPILAQLAPVLPISLREQVILATLARRTKSLKGRGVLQALAPHLSEQVVWNLLRDRQLQFGINLKDFSITKPHKRLSLSLVVEDREEEEICLALLVRLAELGDSISAYKLAMGRWVDEAKKVVMLASLAPYLPSAQSEEALQMVMQVPDSPGYEPALAKLCIRVAEFTGGEKALNHVKELKKSYWRAQALVGIAPHLKEEVQRHVLHEALTTTLQSDFSPQRHRLLAQLSLQLATKWPLPFLYELWRALVAQIAKQTRIDVGVVLCCFNPVITSMRGSEFPLELLQSLEDILRWWP